MNEERRQFWINTYGADTVYSICGNHAYLNLKDADMNAAPGRIDCVHTMELRSGEKIVKEKELLGMNVTNKEEQYGEVIMADNWQHRSKKMRCGTCMWFVKKTTICVQDSDQGAIGRCRRRAPTMSGFPAVFESDWCGDHKLNENV